MVLAEGGDKYEEPPGRLLQVLAAAQPGRVCSLNFDRMQARAPTLSCSPLRKSQWCFQGAGLVRRRAFGLRRSRLTPGRA